MQEHIPPVPPKSFRVTLEVYDRSARLDSLLLTNLREQQDNLDLQNITRTQFKALFNSGRIQIKGQKARPSSSLNRGTTYIDILGF